MSLDIRYYIEFCKYVITDGDIFDWKPKEDAPDYIVEELKRIQEGERKDIEEAHAKGLEVM